jgi:glycolate oxidase
MTNAPQTVTETVRREQRTDTGPRTDFVTNQEVILAARKRVEQGVWDYLVGGSESETTLRRNRLAFDRIAFRPRVLVDVSKIDTSATLMGQTLRIPVILAPIGSLQAFDPGGGASSAQAAEEFGTLQVVSSATQPAPEETAAAAAGPKIFQLYVRGDKAWCRDLLQRVKASGYIGLCFTVDTALGSLRERPMLTGWTRPSRRIGFDPQYQAELTWELMDEIAEMAGLPVLVKGIATAEDALTALEHNVKVIWVSNHGGRQLDHGLGSMDYLPEIVEAVDGQADIIVDGGVQRGSDALKAVAMGASCVAIGRLQAWGLAAAGKDGLVRVLEILEDEIVSAMGLLGVTATNQLNTNYLRKTYSVTPPHEMSSWVNMPGGRVP